MTRKQVAGVVAATAVVSSLSALVAYRVGRSQRHGGDAPPIHASGCFEIEQAAAHTGENGCVAGRVLRVYTSRSGNTFLDFCENYENCAFTSVIFASDRPHFGDLGALEGRRVQLTGEITTYHGQAEIILRDADQIRAAP